MTLANTLKVGKGVPYFYNCCSLAEILKQIAFSSAESCLSQCKCRYKQTEDSWCFQSLNICPSFPSLVLKQQRPSLSSAKLSLPHWKPHGKPIGFLAPIPILEKDWEKRIIYPVTCQDDGKYTNVTGAPVEISKLEPQVAG